MQNRDDDEKYDGSEESYQFTDEDISYEVEESDNPKATHVDEPKSPLLEGEGMNTRKRMIISLAVFVGLIVVAYKIISPSSQDVSTEMTGVAPVIAQQAPQPQQMARQQHVPTAQPPNTQQPQAIVQQIAEQVATPTTIKAPEPTPPPAPEVVAGNTIPVLPTGNAEQPANPALVAAPTSNTAPPQTPASQAAPVATAGTVIVPAPASPPPQQQAAMPTQQVAGPIPVANSMPAVIPVLPSSSSPQLPSSNTDAKIAVLSANADRALSQLQLDYTQKLNDVAVQNKVIQDQIQTLATRVTAMESQFSQLIQTLTQKQEQISLQQPSMMNPPSQQPQVVQQHVSPPPVIEQRRIAYNVQAIIPGRAWLRSDNGETITVAEGDVIKDLGRITKIDPYDGVVEISTGSKTVSLSYGTGA